ncbi:MAG TPA: twin-arginine translocase TatA/TatE family subunit [Candidatus Baltobacteraceae bacterium]|nr:twin-arginine translocase TatA/TatE family subunit [Candidatus Baltobacteraceae bacterium]
MIVHPLLALWDSPMVIGIVVIAAIVLFGADRLPKLARSAGQAKKEFLQGQAEADEAATRAREQARLRAQERSSDPMDNVSLNNAGGTGQDVPPPNPGQGSVGS